MEANKQQRLVKVASQNAAFDAAMSAYRANPTPENWAAVGFARDAIWTIEELPNRGAASRPEER